MSSLKPCPFCKPELSITKYDYTGMTERFPHRVRCMTCGHEMRSETEMGVIQDWNTRPLEDALQSRIAELERENKVLDTALEMACENEATENGEDVRGWMDVIISAAKNKLPAPPEGER